MPNENESKELSKEESTEQPNQVSNNSTQSWSSYFWSKTQGAYNVVSAGASMASSGVNAIIPSFVWSAAKGTYDVVSSAVDAITPSVISGNRWDADGIPRLKGHPLFGRLFYFLEEDGIIEELKKIYAMMEDKKMGLAYLWLGPKPCIVLTDPTLIHRFLRDYHQFTSRKASFAPFRDVLAPDPEEILKKEKEDNQALSTSPNAANDATASAPDTKSSDDDKKAKRKLSPSTSIGDANYEEWMMLRPEYVGALKEIPKVPVINEIISEYFEKKIKGQQETYIDLEDFITRLNLKLLLKSFLVREDVDSDTLDKAVDDVLNATNNLSDNVTNMHGIIKWPLIKMPYLGKIFSHFFGQKNIKELRQEIRGTIKESLIPLLRVHGFPAAMQKVHETSNIDDIIHEVGMFILAGKNSNTRILMLLEYMLFTHPDVLDKLKEELSTVLEGGPVTSDNIGELVYLDKVVKEVLRLYPPAPFLPRGADVDFDFNIGTKEAPRFIRIKKGDTIGYASYTPQHDKTIWGNDADKFRPERFDELTPKQQGAWMAFGGGARMCAGQAFAMRVVKLVAAHCNQNFNVEDIQVEHKNVKSKLEFPPKLTFGRGTLAPAGKSYAKIIENKKSQEETITQSSKEEVIGGSTRMNFS